MGRAIYPGLSMGWWMTQEPEIDIHKEQLSNDNQASGESYSSPSSLASKNPVISVDLMGGDFAPDAPLEACNNFLKDFPDCKILAFAQGLSLKNIHQKYKFLNSNNFSLVESVSSISGEDHPIAALKASKGSSMRMAIEAVYNKEADSIVSAGNTGALMAIAKLILKTLNEIDRPALVGIIPSLEGESCMLDLGANTSSDAKNLFEFALMGSDFAEIILNKSKPSIALLNIGKEEVKGNDTIRTAHEMLKKTDLNFVGYIEGNEICLGVADVIVTEGFSGNICLKTLEGTVKFCVKYIKKMAADSLVAKILLFLLNLSFSKKLSSLDPRKYNGGVFLGLNGIVVKSHGGADALAFYNSLLNAYKLTKSNFIQKLVKKFE